MRNAHKVLAVASAITVLTISALPAKAGDRFRHHNNRSHASGYDGPFTAMIVIGSLGSGLFYDLQPYRQPQYYRRVDRRHGYHGHHHYRHGHRHKCYRDHHRHRRGHGHSHRRHRYYGH